MIITYKKQHIIVIKFLKISTYILAFAGVLLILGAAGSNDINIMSNLQALKQAILGFLLCYIASLIYKIHRCFER